MAMYSAETPVEPDTQNNLEGGGGDEAVAYDPNAEFLQLARDAYKGATGYFDSSIRRKIERAMDHFQNKHPSGSKYNTESYKYRSKGFRPKTRSVIRKNEAAAATAFFSTQDSVHVSPENEAKEEQKLSAEICHSLLNYRLENSIKWFLTLLGGYQDTLNTGICISHQAWEFEEVHEPVPRFNEETGEYDRDEEGEIAFDVESEIVSDKPKVELRPIENFLFSVAADWLDPVGTSPFLIDKIPMHITDIKDMMTPNAKGEVKWHEATEAQLFAGRVSDYDSIRSSREGSREDSKDQSYSTTDFDVVWVHRNIIKKGGTDWLFYTISDQHMLSDPIPLHQEYRHLKHGERPYVIGFSVLETHKAYPAGLNELTTSLQQEANEINNQRRDNVALVLNKRYYAKRGAAIDFRSLTRNIPGSITLMDDVTGDVKSESPQDVTSSSYQEQDRVNMDFDELAGSFSQSSVGSNRKLNETVGGMGMLKGDANEMVEYQIRMFAETWVEPVLKQLVRLEQAYETDEALLGLMGDKVNAWQRYGVDEITDDMLNGSMTVRVNVGFGSTNPEQRVSKLAMGLNTIGTFAPEEIQGMDKKELIIEVMGALGFRGAERFFPSTAKTGEQVTPQDQMIQQLQQQMQGMQMELESRQMEVEGRVRVAEIGQQTTLQKTDMDNQTKLGVEQMKNEGKVYEINASLQHKQWVEDQKRQIDMVGKQLEKERNAIERGKLINQRDALLAQLRMKEQDIIQQNAQDRMSQTIMNDDYGMIPGAKG